MLTAGGEASLEADQQRQAGKIFYADGHVDVRYQNARLRADHVEYDSETQVVVAHGHVELDYTTQHVEADDARYELRTGRGTFHHVAGRSRCSGVPRRRCSSAPIPYILKRRKRIGWTKTRTAFTKGG